MLTNIALVAVQLAGERPINVHAVAHGSVWLGCQREHVPGPIPQIWDWRLIGEVPCQISDLQHRKLPEPVQ